MGNEDEQSPPTYDTLVSKYFTTEDALKEKNLTKGFRELLELCEGLHQRIRALEHELDKFRY
jgi:hypothetical protein